MNGKLAIFLSLLAATVATVLVALTLNWDETSENVPGPEPEMEKQEERLNRQAEGAPAPARKPARKPQEDEEIEDMISYFVRVTRDGAAARDGDKVLARFRKGQELPVINKHAEWHLVLLRRNGKKKLGWLPKKDCRVIKRKPRVAQKEKGENGADEGLWASAAPTFYWSGVIVAAIGSVLIFAEAVNQSILWALVILFVPFAGLIFIFMYWDKVKGAFLISVAGSAICFVGIMMGAA